MHLRNPLDLIPNLSLHTHYRKRDAKSQPLARKKCLNNPRFFPKWLSQNYPCKYDKGGCHQSPKNNIISISIRTIPTLFTLYHHRKLKSSMSLHGFWSDLHSWWLLWWTSWTFSSPGSYEKIRMFACLPPGGTNVGLAFPAGGDRQRQLSSSSSSLSSLGPGRPSANWA